MCQQSVGLIARVLEGHGISTVCVVMNREIIAHVRAPRALHVRFPFGAPLGPAGHPATQEAVIRAALDLLATAAAAGTIADAGIDWPE